MARFITGDELGNIKVYTKSKSEQDSTVTVQDIRLEANKAKAVQALAIFSQSPEETSVCASGVYRFVFLSISIEEKVTCAHADGSTSLHSYTECENLLIEKKHEWVEIRLRSTERFVGLAMSDRYVNKTAVLSAVLNSFPEDPTHVLPTGP